MRKLYFCLEKLINEGECCRDNKLRPPADSGKLGAQVATSNAFKACTPVSKDHQLE